MSGGAPQSDPNTQAPPSMAHRAGVRGRPSTPPMVVMEACQLGVVGGGMGLLPHPHPFANRSGGGSTLFRVSAFEHNK